MKKFTYNIGNPPYGKNSALALKFINKGSEIADNVFFVIPRTFRKPSLINRVDSNLHLVSDETIDESAFPDSIITCKQHWEVREDKRERIETLTEHPHFQFTTVDKADFAVGRVGGGPTAKVYPNPKERSDSSHYYVRELVDGVMNRFVQLHSVFKESALETVGCPSLSKHDIIRLYQEAYGEE